jgi:hypothetical protein
MADHFLVVNQEHQAGVVLAALRVVLAQGALHVEVHEAAAETLLTVPEAVATGIAVEEAEVANELCRLSTQLNLSTKTL